MRNRLIYSLIGILSFSSLFSLILWTGQTVHAVGIENGTETAIVLRQEETTGIPPTPPKDDHVLGTYTPVLKTDLLPLMGELLKPFLLWVGGVIVTITFVGLFFTRKKGEEKSSTC